MDDVGCAENFFLFCRRLKTVRLVIAQSIFSNEFLKNSGSREILDYPCGVERYVSQKHRMFWWTNL